MSFLKCLALVLCITGSIQADEELVWLEDLNSNHDLRNIEIGLPNHLQFNLKRQSGNHVNLQLKKNKRLNANAPVYVADIDENGKQTAREVDVPPIIATKFYQDLNAGAAVKVSCADQPYGACTRVLEGSLYIDGDAYEIKPSPTNLVARGMGSQRNVPHVIEKVAPPPEPKPTDRERGLFGSSHKYITAKQKEGASEHDHKTVPGEPSQRGDLKQDDTPLPEKPNIPDTREELMKELKDLLREEEVEENIQEMFVKENRQKKAVGDLYAVEVVMVVDTSMWKKYYAKVEANNGMDKETATMFFLRQRLAHIMNGVSLRYEAIDDPAMDVYVTISEFLFYKKRSLTSPLKSTVQTPTSNGMEYADSDVYIEGLLDWVTDAPITKHDDHVMVITGYDLYYEGSLSNAGVAGVAYVSGACRAYRVSVQEDAPYFVLTSVAAHELGHNLGAYHDGSGSSSDCKEEDEFLMTPYITSFSRGDPYSLNPWRFSTCSVEAFKTYFASGLCFKDHGDYYDKDEWDEHNSKLPGERFTPTQQCKLVKGDSSYLCSSAQDVEICRTMSCYDPRQGRCYSFAAARGTACGPTQSKKWCIDGACVSKTVAATTQTPGETTQAPGTTSEATQPPQTTSGDSCVDIGWYDWSCQSVSSYFYSVYTYTPGYWCNDPYWAHACCAFCEAATNPDVSTSTTIEPETTTEECVDIGYYNWSCKRVSKYFKKKYFVKPSKWCLDPEWKYNCCDFCARRGV